MLIDAIDGYLKARSRQERAIRCFHPSSLHKSPQELYWHYLRGDAAEDFEPRILRIFEVGHQVHQRLQTYLKEIGMLVQCEVPVDNGDYEIRGHADGIIRLNGLEGVLEIKSMNAGNFFSCFEPKPEHLVQLNVYMFCLGIPRGCLLYECKDDQSLREFFVKEDPGILNPVLQKIRYVQQCIRQGGEPVD